MAKEKKYTEQMPFVGTIVQRILIENQAIEERCSRADVIRQALDQYFGLDDGLMPSGQADPVALPDPRALVLQAAQDVVDGVDRG